MTSDDDEYHSGDALYDEHDDAEEEEDVRVKRARKGRKPPPKASKKSKKVGSVDDLAEIERQRLLNIERNRRILTELHIIEEKDNLQSLAQKPKKTIAHSKKKKKKKEDVTPIRHSSRVRVAPVRTGEPQYAQEVYTNEDVMKLLDERHPLYRRKPRRYGVDDDKFDSACHQCGDDESEKALCSVCTFEGETHYRGVFCGACLYHRYGENIHHINEDLWVCPMCRDLCNCTSCRSRHHLPPKDDECFGFNSVAHYLIHTHITDKPGVYPRPFDAHTLRKGDIIAVWADSEQAKSETSFAPAPFWLARVHRNSGKSVNVVWLEEIEGLIEKSPSASEFPTKYYFQTEMEDTIPINSIICSNFMLQRVYDFTLESDDDDEDYSNAYVVKLVTDLRPYFSPPVDGRPSSDQDDNAESEEIEPEEDIPVSMHDEVMENTRRLIDGWISQGYSKNITLYSVAHHLDPERDFNPRSYYPSIIKVLDSLMQSGVVMKARSKGLYRLKHHRVESVKVDQGHPDGEEDDYHPEDSSQPDSLEEGVHIIGEEEQ